MKLSKKAPRQILFIIAFLLMVSILTLIIYFSLSNLFPNNPVPIIVSTSLNTTPYTAETTTASLPLRLKIPKIKVDSTIESVGLTPEGSMDVPKNTDNVGWFELGKHPGEIGSAVIAGHYGTKNGKSSVFDNLHRLRAGDKIYLEDSNGITISFVVSGSRRYDSNADASGVFISDDGKAHLNLITCEGVWDNVFQSYSKRLVVFADKE